MADQNVVLLSGIVEKRDDRGVSFMMNGEPHANAIVEAVSSHYGHFTDTAAPTVEDVRSYVGRKVTILRHGMSAFGASSIQATPGTIFEGSRGPALLPKGSRKNGISLANTTDLLDIVPSYSGLTVLTERVAEVRGRFPEVEQLTTEHLSAVPDDTTDNDCSLAVFGTWRGPEGNEAGAFWLIDYYMPEDEIVGGVLIVPGYGFSERGSVYASQLLRFGGKVTRFPGMTFADAVHLADLDYYEALARLQTTTVPA